MIITTATIQALQTSFDSSFRAGWSDSALSTPAYSTVVPSTVRTNTYGWMARLPAMRQWVGARVIQNLTNYDYTLTNLPYELTIGVDRDDIADDQLGVYSPLFEELGRAARRLQDDRVIDALVAGTVDNGFDATPFFDNAHPALGVGAAIDNLFAGTALTAANYAAVRAAMSAYQGEDGNPLGVQPNLLVVPPQLEGVARTILNAEIIATAAGTAAETNIWRNSASLIVEPRLAAAPTVWYMMDVSHAIKPLIWQNRRTPQLVSMASETDTNVFLDRQFMWGVDGRGAAGYGPFFLAARCAA